MPKKKTGLGRCCLWALKFGVFEERLAEVNSTIFTKEIELKADARVVYDDFAAKYLEIVDSLKDLNVRNSQIQQVLFTVQVSPDELQIFAMLFQTNRNRVSQLPTAL